MMKIYHRKHFIYGVFMLLLGAGLLVLTVQNGVEWQDIVIGLACIVVGGGFLLRSLSQKMAREDKLEEMDERNQLVLLKNKSCAFRVAQYGSLCLALLFLVIGKVTENLLLLHAGVGLIFVFPLCAFADIFTFIYYDAKL